MRPFHVILISKMMRDLYRRHRGPHFVNVILLWLKFCLHTVIRTILSISAIFMPRRFLLKPKTRIRLELNILSLVISQVSLFTR